MVPWRALQPYRPSLDIWIFTLSLTCTVLPRDAPNSLLTGDGLLPEASSLPLDKIPTPDSPFHPTFSAADSSGVVSLDCTRTGKICGGI